jgi:hypothetical protein
MRIKSSGYVGINTNNPTARLQVVQGNSGGVAAILLSSDESTIQGPSANTQIRMGSNLVLSASNVIPINTNGSERVRITSDGNVGIGTTTPLGKLHVYGLLRVGGAANEQTGIIALGNDANPVGTYGDNGIFRGGIGTLGSGNYTNISSYQGIVFNVAAAAFGSQTTRMIIDVSGNVGIGTTGPTQRLHVLTTGGSATAPNIVATFQANTATTILAGGGTAIKFVGVSSGGNLQDYDQGMISTLGYADNNRHGMQFWVKPNASTVLTVGQTIDSNGHVGIGTTSPITKLHVAGTTSIIPTYDSGSGYSYFLRMGYDTSGSYDYTIKRNGTTGFLEFNGTQGSTYVSYVFAGGDVYSGASGGTIGGFYFNSSSHGIRRATGTNDVYCFTTSGTLYLGAGGSSTTHVRVLSGGDVGIGVSPSYKLDVNGNIHGTGFPTSSDVRFKKNITPLQNSLEKIKKLQGVKYEWNEFVNSRRDGYKLNIPIIGLIAQDVEQVVPEIVDHWKLSEDCQDARSIDYPRLIPLLIEAMKEQQNQIEELRNEIKSLKSN